MGIARASATSARYHSRTRSCFAVCNWQSRCSRSGFGLCRVLWILQLADWQLQREQSNHCRLEVGPHVHPELRCRFAELPEAERRIGELSNSARADRRSGHAAPIGMPLWAARTAARNSRRISAWPLLLNCRTVSSRRYAGSRRERPTSRQMDSTRRAPPRPAARTPGTARADQRGLRDVHRTADNIPFFACPPRCRSGLVPPLPDQLIAAALR